MLSIRSLILPSLDWNNRAHFWSNAYRRKFAQRFASLKMRSPSKCSKSRWLLSQVVILFKLFAQEFCALLERRNEMCSSNNTQNYRRHHVGLILALIGLIGAITLLLSPAR